MDLCKDSSKSWWSVLFIILLSVTARDGQAQEWVYSVRPGDNPWSISDQYLKEMRYWPLLQQRNGITEPNRIPPGTQLRIPIEWLKEPVKPMAVRVLDVRGNAEATLAADGRTMPLQADTTLQAGDLVRTGPNSSALLKFHDASEVLLQANSSLLLDTVNVFESSGLVEAQMNLQQGRLETQVTARQDPAIRYEIRTPAAVAAVRGTPFRVAADTQAQVARTEVTDGSVELISAGQTRVLPEKFGAVAEPSGGNLQAVGLLPAPDMSGLQDNMDTLNFTWPAIPGAQTYRIQLLAYQNQRFRFLVFNNGRLISSKKVGGGEQVLALIHEEVLEMPEFQGPSLPNDNYILRVRGIDPQGLEGLNGQREITLYSSGDMAASQ